MADREALLARLEAIVKKRVTYADDRIEFERLAWECRVEIIDALRAIAGEG